MTGPTPATDFSDAELDRLVELTLATESRRGFLSMLSWAGLKVWFDPVIEGLDRIPDQPTLFIGNHAMLAVDCILLLPLLDRFSGHKVRAMADKAWFQVTGGEMLIRHGIVLGHPRVCSALMEAGHSLLLFPGGAREAVKPEAQRYQLDWGDRTGFVRMAARHGYSITPFGLVGPEEWYRHWREGDDLLDSRLGHIAARLGLLQGLREDLVPPIPKGLLGTLLPRPERCYLAFGDPIEVPRYGRRNVPPAVQHRVRDRAAAEVNRLIADMLALRDQRRTEDGVFRRLLTAPWA